MIRAFSVKKNIYIKCFFLFYFKYYFFSGVFRLTIEVMSSLMIEVCLELNEKGNFKIFGNPNAEPIKSYILKKLSNYIEEDLLLNEKI